MSEFIAILEDQSQSLINRIQNNISSAGMNVTGKTAQSFEYRITTEGSKTSIEILANQFASVVETGRKPTPEKKPSRSMIQNITDWVEARGLESSLVWAIATQINKEGTKLWQAGGRKDIYTLPFEEFVKTLESGILESVVDDYVKLVFKAYGSRNSYGS